ncbi:MAG: hypothetical protein J7501_18665 [Bdellovibrio sp.]|nr:hypothetical protein [Bdellovibrio sp.]
MSASKFYLSGLLVLSAFAVGCQPSESSVKTTNRGEPSVVMKGQALNSFKKIRNSKAWDSVEQNKMMKCSYKKDSFDTQLTEGQTFVREYSFNGLAKTTETLKVVAVSVGEVHYELNLDKTTENGKVSVENYQYKSIVTADGKFVSGQPSYRVGKMPELGNGCKAIDTGADYKWTYELGTWIDGEGKSMPASKEITQKELTLKCPGKAERKVLYTSVRIESPRVLRASGYCLPEVVSSSQVITTEENEILSTYTSLLVSAPLRK